MTLAQMIAARAEAGAAYAAAAEAYLSTWVELSALDDALANGNVGGRRDLATFNELPTVLAHAEFLPLDARRALTSPNVIVPARDARREQLIKGFAR